MIVVSHITGELINRFTQTTPSPVEHTVQQNTEIVVTIAGEVMGIAIFRDSEVRSQSRDLLGFIYRGDGICVVDESSTLEDRLPDDQLRGMLKNQLEYYFSRYTSSSAHSLCVL